MVNNIRPDRFKLPPLMYLRLGNGPKGPKKIEIAARVGLPDMLGIKRAIAARVARYRPLPGGAAARKLIVTDMQMDAARGHIHLDLVAGLHESERAADKAFRRHMQNAGAVAGAAHARIGYTQHVLHARLQ